MAKLHYYTDQWGDNWVMHWEELPKKNGGVYRYWIGETTNGRYGVRGPSRKDILAEIDREVELRIKYSKDLCRLQK